MAFPSSAGILEEAREDIGWTRQVVVEPEGIVTPIDHDEATDAVIFATRGKGIVTPVRSRLRRRGS
jgi:hypothetical protein